MGIHETIDRFLARTPRQQVAFFLLVLAAIAAVLVTVFWLGTRAGDGWASSRYDAERSKNLETIRRHEGNERQMAGENALLKKQIDAAAEILRANDARLAGEAVKFTDLLNERNKRYDEIDADRDFDVELCLLCEDGKRSGFAAFSFCGRCKAGS